MRTPSLRRRATVAGAVVVLGVLLLVDSFIYVTLRSQMEDILQAVLQRRVDLVVQVIDEGGDLETVASRLGDLGVPATVTTADGRDIPVVTAVPRLDELPAVRLDRLDAVPEPRLSTTVNVEGRGTITVLVTRAGVVGTLRRLLVLLAIGTAGGVILALVYLRRAADYALRPLDAVTEAARRTAAGSTGIRLEPDRPGTELGEMAAAFDEMLAALERAVKEAEDAREGGLRFLSDASHQLRTPLAGIRASVDVLLSTEDEEERDRLSSNLLRETSRATRIISSLLRIARLDAGRPPHLEDVDLTALCRDEVERASDLAPGLTVRLDEGETPSRRIALDELAIREAVANLLDNARRHADGVVEVAIVDRDSSVAIEVRDDGPGVKPEVERLVFERFATLDGMGGSGLGLPIARAVARAHGGDLTVQQGAFVLELPTPPPAA